MRTIDPGLAFLCSLALAGSAGPDWKESGAFGFPQREASVLCDTPDLRVSAWNDKAYLFVQAIVHGDGDDSVGETEDGRKVGDRSELIVDADADGKATAKVDREYSLNPWPSMPGLYYQVVLNENSTSDLTGDSKGRGAISYLSGEGATRVRVDSFLIPLEEIGRKPGEKVRIAYWGSSVQPALTLNSVGHRAEGRYYASDLPHEKYHSIILAEREAVLEVGGVPDGRSGTLEKARASTPVVGAPPPEIDAAEWIHWKGSEAPTLQSLAGKVVVVEFWATWCGPCVRGIPHLNELHGKYADKGLVILSLTDQPRRVVDAFLQQTPMNYAIGTSSRSASRYGVTGIPQAFVVGRDSKLVWRGHPHNAALEAKILELLEKK